MFLQSIWETKDNSIWNLYIFWESCDGYQISQGHFLLLKAKKLPEQGTKGKGWVPLLFNNWGSCCSMFAHPYQGPLTYFKWMIYNKLEWWFPKCYQWRRGCYVLISHKLCLFSSVFLYYYKYYFITLKLRGRICICLVCHTIFCLWVQFRRN